MLPKVRPLVRSPTYNFQTGILSCRGTVRRAVPGRLPSALNRTGEEMLESRRRLRVQYDEPFGSTSRVIHRHDPIGINDLGAETILGRLRNCKSTTDVLDVVFEEFVCWFDMNRVDQKKNYKKSRTRFGCFGKSVEAPVDLKKGRRNVINQTFATP
jgi:hypothetical protein